MTPAKDTPLPAADMALLAVVLASGQLAGATAEARAAIDAGASDADVESLLAPASGAFNAAMAACLAARVKP